jgi:hypothetical protein
MGAQPGTYASELKTVSDIPAVPAIPVFAEPSELMRRMAFIPLTHSVSWGSTAYTPMVGTAMGTVLTLIFLPALL